MISTIIPVYNAASYIAEAVDSVLEQTVRSDELIVVDDGSTDDTALVLRRYRGRIRYLHQPNQGHGAALNRGLAEAKGDLLAFLDADDVWMPWKLEVQLAALAADPELDLVFGKTRQFRSPELAPSVAASLVCDDKLQPSPLISNLLVRRRVFDRVGPIGATGLSSFVEWYLRTLEAGLRHKFVAEHITNRRIHTANTTLKHKEVRREYLQLLKASLDRRRAGGALVARRLASDVA